MFICVLQYSSLLRWRVGALTFTRRPGQVSALYSKQLRAPILLPGGGSGHPGSCSMSPPWLPLSSVQCPESPGEPMPASDPSTESAATHPPAPSAARSLKAALQHCSVQPGAAPPCEESCPKGQSVETGAGASGAQRAQHLQSDLHCCRWTAVPRDT